MNPDADAVRISQQQALMSEEADCLARVVRTRDEYAFSRLYDLQSPLLFALACRMLGAEEDAQEVVQEVMLKMWREAGRYDPARGSVRAWSVTMTRSRCLDRLRRRGVVRRHETQPLSDAPEPADDAPMAVEEMVRAETGAAVRRALGALPEEQRRALEASFFDGLSQSQISAASGEPLGTVKTRMRLGMRKLAELLKTYT